MQRYSPPPVILFSSSCFWLQPSVFSAIFSPDQEQFFGTAKHPPVAAKSEHRRRHFAKREFTLLVFSSASPNSSKVVGSPPVCPNRYLPPPASDVIGEDDFPSMLPAPHLHKLWELLKPDFPLFAPPKGLCVLPRQYT